MNVLGSGARRDWLAAASDELLDGYIESMRRDGAAPGI